MANVSLSRIAACYRFLDRALAFVRSGASAVYGGVWLGMLGDDDLRSITAQWYSEHPQYQAATYDLSGLTPWEGDTIERYFHGVRRLLLGACGGGREAIALSKSGFEVDAFDCNPDLVACAQKLLTSTKAKVMIAAPDSLPEALGEYDGFIMGWGGYSHIRPRATRIRFLQDLGSRLKPSSPILLSFKTRTQRGAMKFRVIYAIARILRRSRFAEPPEFGDCLDDIYEHHFTRQEIEDELRSARYELLSYSEDFYGHAVGRFAPENPAGLSHQVSRAYDAHK
jgi:Methyltransferase domain